MAPEINQTNFKPSAAPASSRQEIIPITEVLNDFAQQFQFLDVKTKFGQNFYCSKGECSKEQFSNSIYILPNDDARMCSSNHAACL